MKQFLIEFGLSLGVSVVITLVAVAWTVWPFTVSFMMAIVTMYGLLAVFGEGDPPIRLFKP